MIQSHQLSPIGFPSLLRRLMAMLYDSLLVLALAFAVTAALIAVRVSIEGSEQVRAQGIALQGLYSLGVLIAVAATTASFFAWFWCKNGQTLGMQAWRIRVDDKNNQAISAQSALIRWCVAWVSALTAGLGFFWALLDPRRQTWHDHLSGTQLVLLPKKAKA